MTPEGKVKKDIKDVLHKHGVWYFMPVQNGMGRIGIPDFVCCFHGRFIGIEAKSATGSTTANQERVGDEILDNGGCYIVIRSGKELDDYFNSYGDELKEAVWMAVHPRSDDEQRRQG